jgi:hypothetical protein
MARLNEGESEEGPRFSLLPEETTSDAVVCTLEWLEEAATTPDGLVRAFDLIMVTIRERNQAQEEKQAYKNQIAELREERRAQNKAYETQITELINERDELSHELLQTLRTQAVSRETSPQPATVPKSTKLPHPPVFIGTLDPPFEDWLSKIRSKLKANHDHYPTEDLRMGYVENRVGGTAIKHLAPRLRASATNPYKTSDEMLETLEKVYRDPDRRTTALQEFRKLYQGNRDFNSFWAEFQRLAAEVDYSPETLIDELRNKVSVDLEYAIITETDPVDVYALARKCQQYDINIQRLKARESRIPARNHTALPVQTSQEKAPATLTTSTATTVPCTTQPRTPITD